MRWIVIENGTIDSSAYTNHAVARAGFALPGAPGILGIFTISSSQLQVIFLWGRAIFNFSLKIDLKTTKKVRFCILHKPMGGARAPPGYATGCTQKMIKVTKAEEIIRFFVTFLSLAPFYHHHHHHHILIRGAGIPGLPMASGLFRLVQSFSFTLSLQPTYSFLN